MFPYWLLFGGFSLAALLRGTRFYGERASFLLLWAAAAVTLMIGLRNEVGGDWISYARLYQSIGRLGLTDAAQYPLDPAYTLLNWFSSQLGAGIWMVNLFCGAMLMWGVSRIAIRQPNPWLVFVVAVPYLIIVVGMGYTRQAAAIGLSMVGIAAFLDKRWRAFIIAMVGAALFHKTSIILFPIVALSISTNRFLSMALIFIIGLILFQSLVTDEDIYRMSEYYINAEMQSEGAWIRALMNVCPAALFLVMQRKFGFAEQERKLWRNIAVAALIALIALLLLAWSALIDRISLYFLVIQLVILGRLPWAISRDSRLQLLFIAGVIAYSATIQFVWLNYATHAVVWVPYGIIISS